MRKKEEKPMDKNFEIAMEGNNSRYKTPIRPPVKPKETRTDGDESRINTPQKPPKTN